MADPRARDRGTLARAALLAAVVALPRVARLVFPEIWEEDSQFAAAALLVSHGERPYRDFVQVNLPFLEWIAGGWLAAVGPSVRALEVLTAAAQAGTALLLHRAAARAAGFRAGLLAAAIFSVSSLNFRYHVFEREVFVNLFLAAALVAWSSRATSRLVAVPLSLAILVKVWAAVPVAAFVVATGVRDRSFRPAVRIGAWTAIPVVVAHAALALRFGSDFWLQAYVFHAAKGEALDFGGRCAAFARTADVSSALGFAGLLAGAVRAGGSTASAAAIWAGAEAIGLAVGRGVLWPHNFLLLLPPLALFGGIAMSGSLPGARTLFRTIAAPAAALLLTWNALAHAVEEPAPGHRLRYGFGSIPRASMARAAADLRQACPPDRLVESTSLLLCLEADRLPAVRFPETYGVAVDLEVGREREGLRAYLRRVSGEGFLERIARTRRHATDRLARLISEDRVGALALGHGSPLEEYAAALARAGRRGEPVPPTEGAPAFRIARVVP